VCPDGVQREGQLTGCPRSGQIASQEAEHVQLTLAQRVDEALRHGGRGRRVTEGGEQSVGVATPALTRRDDVEQRRAVRCGAEAMCAT
jgi:hypothetical protein